MKLWLDDIREPWKHGCLGWEWAKTADEAIRLLASGKVTECSLDHDLTEQRTIGVDDKSLTGCDVLLWLEKHPQYWPVNGVRVHSLNPLGRQRMEQVIARCLARKVEHIHVR
jgi:hypothetical protein